MNCILNSQYCWECELIICINELQNFVSRNYGLHIQKVANGIVKLIHSFNQLKFLRSYWLVLRSNTKVLFNS
ncbi:hypothetical protein T4D_8899 [Trichinella pseudospiralis]|uniref:Uncharacterized protein n=1 Tax=Trichinella pseudospiralis TaxID=6337 RepID=A0A0V1FN94_TRIPS|nr:hypothetical protein T4D_8899 [Trichinella pseudospiralis]